MENIEIVFYTIIGLLFINLYTFKLRIWKQYRTVVAYAADKASKSNDHLSIGLWFKSQSKLYKKKLAVYIIFVILVSLIIYYALDNEKSYWITLLVIIEIALFVEHLKTFDYCNKTCVELLGYELIKIAPHSFEVEGFPYILKQYKSGFINKELFMSCMGLVMGGYSFITKFGLTFELTLLFYFYSM